MLVTNGIGDDIPSEGTEQPGKTCCICNEQFVGHGHNPAPLEQLPKLCCDECHIKTVMPARMKFERYAKDNPTPYSGARDRYYRKWLKKNYPPMMEPKDKAPYKYGPGDA